MKLPRRYFLHLAACAAALPTISRVAWAQAYPSRPVRWIVGFPAGGGSDVLARLVAQWLSERLGQPFVIENRPGAGTNIATEAVVRAPPDGYTLLQTSTPAAINATLYNKLNFNVIQDIAPIAGITRSTYVMAVHPSFPAQTVREFIAYAKANPGKISMASFGTGTTSHVAGELFKMMTGVNMLHVPYRGSTPMLTDLLGGQVQATFDNLPASIEHIRAGKLRPLAVTTTMRSETMPELPTMAEFLPGFEASAWSAVGAPNRTPAEIVDKLNKEINAGLGNLDIRARLANVGATAFTGSPGDFSKLVGAEIEKWGKVVKFSGMKPE